MSLSSSTAALVFEALYSASSQASVPALCTTGASGKEVSTGRTSTSAGVAASTGAGAAGGGDGGDRGDGGGGGGEGGGWHACECASKGIAVHVSVSTKVSKRLCRDTWHSCSAWQVERPHKPLSAPESKRSNLVKSTS